VTEEQVPQRNDGGQIVYNITRYEYDQVGNRTKVITPPEQAPMRSPGTW
jgi:hypothetical protein